MKTFTLLSPPRRRGVAHPSLPLPPLPFRMIASRQSSLLRPCAMGPGRGAAARAPSASPSAAATARKCKQMSPTTPMPVPSPSIGADALSSRAVRGTSFFPFLCFFALSAASLERHLPIGEDRKEEKHQEAHKPELPSAARSHLSLQNISSAIT